MRVERPWGWMKTLIARPTFWVKILRVTGRTSLQYHGYRFELMIGTKCAYIPPFKSHRLLPGWYLEIAWGRPLEADIVRISDDYGRV